MHIKQNHQYASGKRTNSTLDLLKIECTAMSLRFCQFFIKTHIFFCYFLFPLINFEIGKEKNAITNQR